MTADEVWTPFMFFSFNHFIFHKCGSKMKQLCRQNVKTKQIGEECATDKKKF